MKCPTCNSSISTFTLNVALLWIGVGVALLISSFTWWRLDALDDRLSRMPVVRPSVVSVGNYASVRVYKDSEWVVTPEQPDKEVFKNSKGGKK